MWWLAGRFGYTDHIKYTVFLSSLNDSAPSLSHREPASAATSCDGCGARVPVEFYFIVLLFLPSPPIHIILFLAIFLHPTFWSSPDSIPPSSTGNLWWSDFSGGSWSKSRPRDNWYCQWLFSAPLLQVDARIVAFYHFLILPASSFVSSATFSLPYGIQI